MKAGLGKMEPWNIGTMKESFGGFELEFLWGKVRVPYARLSHSPLLDFSISDFGFLSDFGIRFSDFAVLRNL